MLDLPNVVVYQLKVTLRGISPLIWRRFLVRAETSVADLHRILQPALGWTNSRLHRFIIHGKEYDIAYEGGVGFDGDSRNIRLADFCFRLRERFLYEHDFDDNWQHATVLLRRMKGSPNAFIPSTPISSFSSKGAPDARSYESARP